MDEETLRRRRAGVGERYYRSRFDGGGTEWFRLAVEQTDLMIGVSANDAGIGRRRLARLSALAEREVRRLRAELEAFIRFDPSFLTRLDPMDCPPDAPPVVREMCLAAGLAGVGPMAAVAGAMAEQVGRRLATALREADPPVEVPGVIVENGGDLWLTGGRERIVGIVAGSSPLSGRIGVRIRPEQMPCGVCSSSGTMGHSLSFGRADAAMVLAESAALADAAASALGNRIRNSEDIEAAVAHAMRIPGVAGVVAVLGEHLGAAGDVELTELELDDRAP